MTTGYVAPDDDEIEEARRRCWQQERITVRPMFEILKDSEGAAWVDSARWNPVEGKWE